MRSFVLFVCCLFALWIGAWLIRIHFLPAVTPWSLFAYWTIMKLVIWIGFPVLAFARSASSLRELFSLSDRGVNLFGRPGDLLLAGMAATLLAYGAWASFTKDPYSGSVQAAVNVIVVAPILEELLFRGFIWQWLKDLGYRHGSTILISAALFAALHIVGWTAMGREGAIAVSVAGVFFAGLIFGVARMRLGLIAGGIAAHLANNLMASGLFWSLLAALYGF
jgi:membrane protease YdiL (CAAX protease family)